MRARSRRYGTGLRGLGALHVLGDGVNQRQSCGARRRGFGGRVRKLGAGGAREALDRHRERAVGTNEYARVVRVRRRKKLHHFVEILAQGLPRLADQEQRRARRFGSREIAQGGGERGVHLGPRAESRRRGGGRRRLTFCDRLGRRLGRGRQRGIARDEGAAYELRHLAHELVEFGQLDRILEADTLNCRRLDRLERRRQAAQGFDKVGDFFDFDLAQKPLDRFLRHEFLVGACLLHALFVQARDRARLGDARRQQVVAKGERAFARGLEERRVLKRQQDDRVLLERHQLPEARGIIVSLGPGMRAVPMLAQEPAKAPNPASEAFDIAVEDRELR